ncbi:MAG: hypothetical protein E6K72_11620 [Candidatus Eisenbacteria bacterium]|uniref:Uncharacterized protein n=1 Tax=Eiseniibacteriota bacterium TaxID=2212470 RepID=A0A538SFR3_UNCEI|nr:MAG: hypothetical protein E6K72_11620 [Candidatus Eisenbacteria bacterium]
MTPVRIRVPSTHPFARGVYQAETSTPLVKLLVPLSGPPAISAATLCADPRVASSGLSRRSRSNES